MHQFATHQFATRQLAMHRIAALTVTVFSMLGAAKLIHAQQPNSSGGEPRDQKRRITKDQRVADWLREQDANGDEKIALGESRGRMKANFRRIDANGDGYVDKQELAALATRLSRSGNSKPSGRLEGVAVFRDIEYAKADGFSLKLDIYTPQRQAATPRPLLVWIHGGAWRAGDKKQCPAIRFVRRGYVVASINYRLSQQAIFPAQIHDCKAAIRWLRANAKTYSIDAQRVGVWGSSAGGHLVALLGTSANVTSLSDPAQGHAEQSSRVQAVCDFFGPTDLLQMDAHALPSAPFKHAAANSPESQLIGGPIQSNRGKAAKANPISYVTKDAPPFLIVHGDQDRLVPLHQSQLLADALKKAGVKVEFHTLKGLGHGFGGNRHVDKLVDAFFDEILKTASKQGESSGKRKSRDPQQRSQGSKNNDRRADSTDR